MSISGRRSGGFTKFVVDSITHRPVPAEQENRASTDKAVCLA